MIETTTPRKKLARILTSPRRLSASPDSLVFVVVRSIGVDGIERTAQACIPAEILAEIGEELENG